MVTLAEQVAFPAIFSATQVYTPESVVMALSKVKVHVSGGSKSTLRREDPARGRESFRNLTVG